MKKLITELQTIDGITEKQATLIAEYIFRGVNPLVRHKIFWCGNWKEYTASVSINETLKFFGAEN